MRKISIYIAAIIMVAIILCFLIFFVHPDNSSNNVMKVKGCEHMVQCSDTPYYWWHESFFTDSLHYKYANEIVLYQPNEQMSLEVKLDNETVWLTQQQIADLFGVKIIKKKSTSLSVQAYLPTKESSTTGKSSMPIPSSTTVYAKLPHASSLLTIISTIAC